MKIKVKQKNNDEKLKRFGNKFITQEQLNEIEVT